jgi:hypothetical protein
MLPMVAATWYIGVHAELYYRSHRLCNLEQTQAWTFRTSERGDKGTGLTQALTRNCRVVPPEDQQALRK